MIKPVVTKARDFAIWKTVILGLKKSPSDYFKAIRENGYHINDRTAWILHEVQISNSKIELGLVLVTSGDPGFVDCECADDIYSRAISLGLQRCPTEVGPALRLAHRNQERRESLRVAMRPISGSDGSSYVFTVDHFYDVDRGDSGEQALHSQVESGPGILIPGRKFVFASSSVRKLD